MTGGSQLTSPLSEVMVYLISVPATALSCNQKLRISQFIYLFQVVAVGTLPRQHLLHLTQKQTSTILYLEAEKPKLGIFWLQVASNPTQTGLRKRKLFFHLTEKFMYQAGFSYQQSRNFLKISLAIVSYVPIPISFITQTKWPQIGGCMIPQSKICIMLLEKNKQLVGSESNCPLCPTSPAVIHLSSQLPQFLQAI